MRNATVLFLHVFRASTIAFGVLGVLTFSARAADDAAKSKQPSAANTSKPLYGDPQAPAKMTFLQNEIQHQLQEQGRNR